MSRGHSRGVIVGCPFCHRNTWVSRESRACENCGKTVPERHIERAEPSERRGER